MAWQHISDEDLERYHLGMVKAEAELAPIEEHLLACAACVERAGKAAEYADALRAAMTAGDLDLE
jgi:predicted anti-sigma-YlaC factor YlaD